MQKFHFENWHFNKSLHSLYIGSFFSFLNIIKLSSMFYFISEHKFEKNDLVVWNMCGVILVIIHDWPKQHSIFVFANLGLSSIASYTHGLRFSHDCPFQAWTSHADNWVQISLVWIQSKTWTQNQIVCTLQLF